MRESRLQNIMYCIITVLLKMKIAMIVCTHPYARDKKARENRH